MGRLTEWPIWTRTWHERFLLTRSIAVLCHGEFRALLCVDILKWAARKACVTQHKGLSVLEEHWTVCLKPRHGKQRRKRGRRLILARKLRGEKSGKEGDNCAVTLTLTRPCGWVTSMRASVPWMKGLHWSSATCSQSRRVHSGAFHPRQVSRAGLPSSLCAPQLLCSKSQHKIPYMPSHQLTMSWKL